MKIAAIDGNSILNRAFYGVRLLSNTEGTYTNAIFGFMNILQKVISEVKPDGFAFAFDLPAPTFRHNLYDGYKAGRKGMPEELAMQLPLIKELLRDLGYTIVETPGYEADDILGTLAHICNDTEHECVIVTGDRDCLQLVSEQVHVRLATTKAGNPLVTLYGMDEIREKYGVTPKQLIEVKALMGDASDNIPGVAGIGEKTALSLIQQYETVDNIYENLDSLEIKEGVRTKLRNGKDSAYMSRTLAEISTEAPVPRDAGHYAKSPGDPAAAVALLKRLEMYKLIERLELDTSLAPAPAVENQGTALSPLPVKEAGSLADLQAFIQTADKLFLSLELEEVQAVGFALSDGKEIVTAASFTLDFPAMLGEVLSCDKEKICHNSKDLFHYGFSTDLPVRGIRFDTALAGYILNPLAKTYEAEQLADAYSSGLPLTEGTPTVRECSALCAIYEKLQAEITANGQNFLLDEVELPLSKVLASMEVIGFDIDIEGVHAFGSALSAKIKTLEQGIYEKAGETFNINSPKQLGEILFTKLGLPAKKKTKSGYSTNADVLESLRPENPIIDEILEYRQLSKLNSTYVEGLIKVVADDGRIHTRFNQTETRTGRISSTEPNMQNIPVRTDLGSEMRRFFHAEADKVLVDADYSQIELRVLAHIAKDENMAAAFREGMDIHTSTAARVFNVPIEMVTPKMRSDSKAVNFGIVYGISAFSLAGDIGVSVKEAKKYIEEYLNTYSGVRDYMKETIEFGKEHGYVQTLFGRRRNLPELSASNRVQRSFGERVAMNMPIQGTAADIIKIAMVRVYDRLEAEGMTSRLILQVHDELIIEAPEAEAEKARAILKEEMEKAVQLDVPLPVDVGVGKDWYSAKGD